MGREIHNRMAQFAFDQVKGIEKTDKEFRSLARSMPSMIQVNGLGAAVAFLYSKKNQSHAHKKMYELLNQWFASEACFLSEGKDDLIKCIVNLDSGSYRLYVNEVMNLCLWVKRFAEGMMEGEVE